MMRYFNIDNNIRSQILILLLIALILRLTLFLIISAKNPARFFQPDSYGYWRIADNIVKNHAFSSSITGPFLPEHNRTPFYPLFISLFRLFNLGERSVIFAQICLSVAICAIVIMITCKLTNFGLKPALVAGLLIAFDIPSIVISNSLLTETLFTFLLLIGLLFFISYLESENLSWLFFSAVSLGLSTLSRPAALLLPFILLLVFFLQKYIINKRQIINMSLFLLIYILMLSPWLIRNEIIFGRPFLSTIGYDNLLYFQAAGIESVVKGIPLEDARKEIMQKFENNPKAGHYKLDLMQMKSEQAKLAYAIIKTHPFIYFKNYFKSIFNMLFRPIRSDLDLMLGLSDEPSTLQLWGNANKENLFLRFFQNTSFLTIILCVFQIIAIAIVYILFISGILLGINSIHKTIIIAFSLTIIYFCITSGAPETYARFRVPIMPFLCIIAGLGIFKFQKHIQNS